MADTIYTLGPTTFGLIAALAIAAYLWGRLRIASVIVLTWFVAAAAIGQVTLFPGFPDWQVGDWRGFLIFGTLAFLPAGLLLFAALRVAPVMTALAGIPTSALVLTQVSASFMGIVNLDPAPVMMGNPPLLVISLFALNSGSSSASTSSCA